MRKVYNLKIEVDAPKYMMSDEEFCNGLKEVFADEIGDEIQYVKMTAECIDKDEQIINLQHRIKILEEALGLACKRILKNKNISHTDKNYYLKVVELKQDYLDIAESELKGE